MSAHVYLEDFEIGNCMEYGHYEVTKEEIIEFASRYDPQPFHLSEEGGKATHFGGLCASGWHTCAMVMSMTVANMAEGSQSLGSPGIDELRWKKPVYPGDVLRVKSTIAGKRNSQSRPDMGTLFLENEVLNQNDEVVMTFKPIVMYKRRGD